MALIRPTRPQVFLKQLNKTVFVNFITLADEEWINENYPNGQIDADLQAGTVATILSLFWRLLDSEGKRLIAECELAKWDGMKETQMIVDDPVEKLKYVISGSDEIMAILKAIFKTNELSQPDALDNQKKNLKVDQS